MNHSAFKNYLFSRKDFETEQKLIRKLCNGFALNKFDLKSKLERRKFRVRMDMCRIEWYKPMPGYEEFEGYIDFRDIKEIRINEDFITKVSENFTIKQTQTTLNILYGKKFCLQKLSCIGKH